MAYGYCLKLKEIFWETLIFETVSGIGPAAILKLSHILNVFLRIFWNPCVFFSKGTIEQVPEKRLKKRKLHSEIHFNQHSKLPVIANQ